MDRGPEASWHADFRDTAYIYIGGLPFELSEGDIITIFSQFGEPTYVNLIRDKETGKSRGFAFLKYEDQRSTDLAVDNLGGTVVMGRTLRVDHTRYKRKDDDEGETDANITNHDMKDGDGDGDANAEPERPLLKEERELVTLMRDHDEDDPMKAFLIQEKREEIAAVLAGDGTRKHREHKSRHRSRHSHHAKRGTEELDGRGRESHGRRRERERRSTSGDRRGIEQSNYRERSNDRHGRGNGDHQERARVRSSEHRMRRQSSEDDPKDRRYRHHSQDRGSHH